MQSVKRDLIRWKKKMQKSPGLLEKGSKNIQIKINGLYPEKYHTILTTTIKSTCKTVLLGSQYTASPPLIDLSLEERDRLAISTINKYKKIALLEGAGTGAGGIVAGIADFPLLLSIKIKLLYEIAAIYGFNTTSYKERFYILSIFELTFSSQSHTNTVFKRINHWEQYKLTLPSDLNAFDWRTFQQEYRDYLDLAKLMQMLPLIGAPVGAYVNHKLVTKLGDNAIAAYRLRWVQ
ncbi:MAG: EcsC family protein [Cellulosilyticaceae bacterium]